MSGTTLVTLKARKGALEMAMGVLHGGRLGELRAVRCCQCGIVVSVPGGDPRQLCSECDLNLGR